MTKTKVVIIHNIVSPHVSTLFKEIAKRVDITVLYCAERESNRSWSEFPSGFKYKVLKNFSIKFQGKDLFTYFINLTIFKELNQIKPDLIIIAGWDLFAYQMAFLYCKFKKIKIILWSGSTKFETSWRRNLSLPLVRLIVKNSDSFLAYGKRAREYLETLGAPENKITIAYNVTDVWKNFNPDNLQAKSEIKKKLDLADERVIFYYGQLIERKGVDLLIKAFKLLREKHKKVKLVIVGSGNYKERLLKLSEHDRSDDTVFLPDLGDRSTSEYFRAADLFVLPSKEEVWGLVVNMAMAYGLPVIVSSAAGSSADLVKNGKNGYVFKTGSVKDLVSKITLAISDKQKLMEMGESSLKTIQDFTPQKTAAAILSSIASLV